MRRLLLPVTLALSLATGLVLWDAGSTLTGPPGRPGDDPGLEATTLVVRRFYDAVNAALATGDAVPLGDVVAADFVNHVAYPGLAPTRDGLARWLDGLHAAFPAMRLTVEDLVAQGDRVAARVRVDGATEGATIGIAAPPELAAWGTLDVFRVTAGQVAERWGGLPVSVVAERPIRAPLAAPSIPSDDQAYFYAVVAVRVQRLTVAAGAEIEPPVTDASILSVPDGRLVARVEPPAELLRASAAGGPGRPEAAAGGRDAVLERGDTLVLPVGTVLAVRNIGPVPAVAVVTTVATMLLTHGMPPDLVWDSVVPIPPTAGVVVETLAASPAGPLTANRPEAVVGRVTLAPGTRLPARDDAAPHLVVVESGTLRLTAPDGTVWIRRGAQRVSEESFPVTLTAGDGAVVPPGVGAAFDNAGDGPLVVLIVAITPAEPAIPPAKTT